MISNVTEVAADWPCVSVTVSDSVVDPVCSLPGARVIVQSRVVEPQPELIEMAASGSMVVLLLLAVTVSAPEPLSVKAMGASEFGRLMD